MKDSRKKINFVVAVGAFLFVCMPFTHAAADPAWTWMGGNDIIDQQSVYGTPGMPDAANIPGARDGSISWTDSAGDLWSFGGFGYDSTGAGGNLNDLWRYSTDSGEWAWMSGSDTINQQGVYGVPGFPDADNMPGARDGSISWSDSSGNLWAFGGWGYDKEGDSGMLNDVWRYTTATGEWTWICGADTVYQGAVYGTQGVASTANIPGARYWGVCWTDNAGNLWLFGGYGLDAHTNEGDLNDLWRYSPSTGTWTWMSGSDTVEQAGTYGTKGTAAPANVPGGRETGVSWADNDGNLWLFGGYGFDKNGDYGLLNDLWRYSIAMGQWTWMSGSDTVDAPGVYGTMGVPADVNVPCSRFDSISWTDSFGNLWLSGGWGRVCGEPAGWGAVNDLWRYRPVTGEWTWMAGENMTNRKGVYGILGEPDDANVPGSRQSSTSWIDDSGDLWLFGGIGFASDNSSGKLNDLWRYSAGSQCCTEGSCPEGYGCVDGACQLDQPPELLCEPLWFGAWVGLSSDPAQAHKPDSDNVLFWTFDDDRVSCQGVVNRWMYRPVELQAGQAVPIGEWVIKVPSSYLWYVWIENPGIADTTGPGLFEFKMMVTDCLGQGTDSEGFYGKRYYFQVE